MLDGHSLVKYASNSAQPGTILNHPTTHTIENYLPNSASVTSEGGAPVKGAEVPPATALPASRDPASAANLPGAWQHLPKYQKKYQIENLSTFYGNQVLGGALQRDEELLLKLKKEQQQREMKEFLLAQIEEKNKQKAADKLQRIREDIVEEQRIQEVVGIQSAPQPPPVIAQPEEPELTHEPPPPTEDPQPETSADTHTEHLTQLCQQLIQSQEALKSRIQQQDSLIQELSSQPQPQSPKPDAVKIPTPKNVRVRTQPARSRFHNSQSSKLKAQHDAQRAKLQELDDKIEKARQRRLESKGKPEKRGNKRMNSQAGRDILTADLQESPLVKDSPRLPMHAQHLRQARSASKPVEWTPKPQYSQGIEKQPTPEPKQTMMQGSWQPPRQDFRQPPKQELRQPPKQESTVKQEAKRDSETEIKPARPQRNLDIGSNSVFLLPNREGVYCISDEAPKAPEVSRGFSGLEEGIYSSIEFPNPIDGESVQNPTDISAYFPAEDPFPQPGVDPMYYVSQQPFYETYQDHLYQESLDELADLPGRLPLHQPPVTAYNNFRGGFADPRATYSAFDAVRKEKRPVIAKGSIPDVFRVPR